MPVLTGLLLFALTTVMLAYPAKVRAAESNSRLSASKGESGFVSQKTSPPMSKKSAKKRNLPSSTSQQSAVASTTKLEEVVVEAPKLESSASAQIIPSEDFALKPHDTPIQLLNDLPGLVAVQHQGGGKAPQYLLRGFDADHGTDVAIFNDGAPVNLVSHAHGQGYANINAIIPETIDHIDFSKGPYYAKYGDFDNAGAIDFVTKQEFDHNFIHAEGGSWETQRYVAGASPKFASWLKTLIAGQMFFTNGPFNAPEHDQRYNLLFKFSEDISPDVELWESLSLYHGRWDGSGQIPLREVSRGLLSRFGSIDPHEGGYSDSVLANLNYRYTPTPNDSLTVQLYGQRYKLDLFTDFTFYKDTGLRFILGPGGHIIDTRDGPIVPGAIYIPGDGIEQNDSRIVYGLNAQYTHSWMLAGRDIQSELGIQNRNDDIDLGLYRQVQRQRFFTINNVHLVERSVSGWTQQRIIFNEWARLILGLRGDVFFFGAHNRLPPQNPDPNFDPVTIQGSTSASIVSPKASLVITPAVNTDFYLNFGTGFHSNDARDAILTQNTTSPLARSIGWEVGARTRQFNRLNLEAAFWFLDLDSELVFSGDAGNQETAGGGNFVPSAATRRWGVDFQGNYQLTEWLSANYNMFYADPRFRSSGQAIPLAPTLLMEGDLTVASWHGFSTGLRVRFLDDRPASEDRSLIARGYTLVDLVSKYQWRRAELSLQFLNLTGHDWREAQFSDNSCVRNEVGVAAGCVAAPGKQNSHPVDTNPDVHFTPGNLFTVIGGLLVLLKWQRWAATRYLVFFVETWIE